MPCLFSLEYSEGIAYKKFISKKQMLDTILSLRPLSGFTQTAFESKKIYMANRFDIDSSVSMHFFVQSLVLRMQAYQ